MAKHDGDLAAFGCRASLTITDVECCGKEPGPDSDNIMEPQPAADDVGLFEVAGQGRGLGKALWTAMGHMGVVTPRETNESQGHHTKDAMNAGRRHGFLLVLQGDG